MTPAELAQIEAAKEALPKATPGPWMVRRDDCHFCSATEISNGHRIIAETNREWDSPIIAAAPVLTRRVIELEGEIARLKEWQWKAVPYLDAYSDSFPNHNAWEDGCHNEIAALIAQAQEGGER